MTQFFSEESDEYYNALFMSNFFVSYLSKEIAKPSLSWSIIVAIMSNKVLKLEETVHQCVNIDFIS
jgi:hypothetical protein